MFKQQTHYILIILTSLSALIISFLVFSFCFDLIKPYANRPFILTLLFALWIAVVFGVLKVNLNSVRLFSISFLIFFFVFNAFEFFLRKQAFLSSKDILNLNLLNDFYADADGIYIADPAQRKLINDQGFRSRDFYVPNCEDQPKVLFLGDSFTWGAEADVGKSFVALTDSGGYCTFNTGIPSTDPAQYLAVAQKYLPVIKPDIVLVMFCMDNDILWCERPILPHVPITYATDGVINGLLIDGFTPNSCPLEPFNSFEEAKRILSQHFFLYDTTLWGHTAIGTLFTKKLKESPYTNRYFDLPEFPSLSHIPEQPVSDRYLSKIQELCDERNIPLWIFIIPSKGESIVVDVDYYRNKVPMIFEEYNPDYLYCPENITLSDYQPDPDAHLNNQGHLKFSEAIVSQLDEYFVK